eukprot:gene17425-22977_t
MDEEEVEIEEDQHHDNNENEEEESDSDSVDSAYHSWVLRNANSNVRSSNGPFTTELNISALNRMRGNVPSDINLYVTPPDRIRQDPLQVIMTDLRTGNVLESPEDMIRRLIQDASDNIGLFNSSTDAVYALRNNGIVAMSSVSQNSSERVSNNGNNLTSQFLRQALPGGIDMALQVHRPVLLHPLLAGTEFLQQTNRSGNSTNSNSNDANIDNIGGSSQSSRFPLIRSDNMRIFDIPHGPPGAIRRDAIISHQVSDNRETSTIRDLSPTFIGNDVIASILLDNLVSALTDNCLVDNDPVPLLVDHVVSQNESTNETQIVPDSPNIQLAEESEAVPADDDETIVDTNEGIDNYSATESEVTRVENVGDVLTIGSSATESIGTSINESLMGNRSLQDTLAGTSLSVSILTNDAIRGPTDFDNVSMLSSIPTSESDDDEEAKENVTDNGEIVQNNIIFEDVVTDLNQTNIVTEMNDNEIEDSPSNVLQDNDTSDLNEPLQESAVPQVSAIACPVGYDSDVFYSLPENMQLEIMEQHSQTSQQTRQLIEQAGYDYEMFESLPENIRQEILDQARRDSGGNNESLLSSAIPAEPTPSDNVSFLMSLTPELRADILLTADAAFLDSLPSDLFAEAQRHRDQAARRLQDQEILRTEYQSNNLQRSNNATIQSVIGRLGLSDTLGINDNEEDEELANKSDSKQDAKIDNKESSINTNESDNSVDSKTVQTPSNKATIAITVSIPGLRHRQSYEYKRMNISLIDESQTSASTLPTPTQSFVYSGSINPISLLRSKSLKPSYNPKEYVFEDSYDQLRGRSKDEILLGRLQVTFNNEQGIDAGGLTREWFSVLSKEIFNPNYALFTSALDGATFQPNPFSMINSNHLSYFKFIGNVIGKAINDGQLMDAHFTRSFYKHLLGIPVDYVDIEATEPDYYNTLKQILDNPLESLMIDLTFSAESQIFGKTEVVDLIPNGRNIPVDDENKFDYVRLISHHRMTTAIKAQIESFLDEIELLICGLPDVDITDLKANTEYHGVRLTDEIISWFWEALNGFSQTERASFLQFVTGTSKVPLGGFSNLQGMRGTQKFSIHKAYGDHNQLPTAHTCFNQLDLPIYNSYEELKAKLLLAIREGSEGFGFA